MVRLFEERKEIVIASGVMLHDGGRSSIISRGEARNLCVAHDSQGSSSTALSYTPMDFAYGCNMVCRYSRIRSIRFDERLPLYAWLEDSDFSHRATRGFHEPVRCLSAIAVHLGWRAGRFSGLRLGFSTIVNPVYLRRKSGTFTIKFILVNLWARCLAGNIIGILTRDKEYDRVGLLRGNLVGFIHLLSGRCDPAHILEL
jgi:GT2 family glycosyltransferase